MFERKKAAFGALLMSLLFSSRGKALAQGAYEIEVYGSETADPGSTFVELHSNTAFKGPPAGPGFGLTRSTDDLAFKLILGHRF